MKEKIKNMGKILTVILLCLVLLPLVVNAESTSSSSNSSGAFMKFMVSGTTGGLIALIFWFFSRFKKNKEKNKVVKQKIVENHSETKQLHADTDKKENFMKEKIKENFKINKKLFIGIITGVLVAGGIFYLYSQSKQKYDYDNAEKESRDARKIADIKQIQQALEMYFDVNYKYPDNLQELAVSVSHEAYGYKPFSGIIYSVKKGVNVRSCPSLQCEVIAQTTADGNLEVSVHNSDWYKWEFTFSDADMGGMTLGERYRKRTGYISSSVVEKINSSARYHLWAELEKHNPILDNDADINSSLSGGIDGSKEFCTSAVSDCIYDVSP